MYSYEIEALLRVRNNLVSLKEYIDICNSSQVDHVEYKDDEFHIWTNDNYSFKLKIKREHNN